MKRFCGRPLFFCPLVALLSGCFSLLPAAPVPKDYRLEYDPPSVQHPPIPVVLRLSPVRVAAVYDREPFAYSTAPFRIAYRYYHRWATAPGQMLTDLFVRDFTTSGLYRAVQQGPSVLVADYQLDLRVERFEEQVASSGCHAVIVVHANLQSLRPRVANPVRLQQLYEEREPVQCGNAEDFARGTSRAVRRLSERLQLDVVEAITRSENEKLVTSAL